MLSNFSIPTGLGLAGVLLAGPGPAEVTLIADGHPQAILVAQSPAAQEPTEELAAYLEKMSGATLPVIRVNSPDFVSEEEGMVRVALTEDLPDRVPPRWRDLAGQIRDDGYALIIWKGRWAFWRIDR